jgi:trk system potassium uptake protein TrkA
MKIIIIGAGVVGKAICRDLQKHSTHELSLVDIAMSDDDRAKFKDITLVVGDSCSPDVLAEAGAKDADVLVAATHDDQVNLVTTLLAKTEFGIAKTIARINHPKNEFLFNQAWGVDESVSMPNAMLGLIEESVVENDIVPVMKFNNTPVGVLKYRVGHNSHYIGMTKEEFVSLNAEFTLVAIVRGENVISPFEDLIIERGDIIVLLGRDE